MRTRLLCVGMLATGLLGGVATVHAWAQPEGPGKHTPPAGHHHADAGANLHQHLMAKFLQHMAQFHAELNLTDAQKSAAHDAFRARHADLAAAFRPVVESHRALLTAIHAQKVDEAALRAAGDAIGRSVGDAAIVIARVKGEVLTAAALTPEQTQKLAEIHARFDTSVGELLDSLPAKAQNQGR